MSSRIVVCGAGTVGGNLLEHLARQGVLGLEVVDRDRVEERNLANQPYLRAQVGQPKPRALAEVLFRASGYRLATHCRSLDESSAPRLLRGAGVVVDALDNSEGRRVVHEACQSLGIPCLHVGLSPEGYAEAIWGEHYQVPPDVPGDPCGTPILRSLSLLAVVLAARALEAFQARGERGGYTVTLGDLQVATFP